VSVVTGTVTRGLGRAAKRLESISCHLEDALGFRPYPGTLNIQLTEVFKPPTNCLFIDVSELGARKTPFRLFKARLNGYSVWVARSASQRETSDTLLGIIGDVKLRETLNVCDGDTVQLEFECRLESSCA